jgi:hypothetical protein
MSMGQKSHIHSRQINTHLLRILCKDFGAPGIQKDFLPLIFYIQTQTMLALQI